MTCTLTLAFETFWKAASWYTVMEELSGNGPSGA